MGKERESTENLSIYQIYMSVLFWGGKKEGQFASPLEKGFAPLT